MHWKGAYRMLYLKPWQIGRSAFNYTPEGTDAHIMNLSLQWSMIISELICTKKGVRANIEMCMGDWEKWPYLLYFSTPNPLYTITYFVYNIIQWHAVSCNEHAVFCELPAHGLLESTHARCWNLHIQCESSAHGLLKSMHPIW